ncbi:MULTISPECIES: GNAT family N-acetyltransferase [Brevibacterium]|uniref:Acetyltransferase (GNAT) family protein n=3 Tax=Brevibacterium aurantiacum TaxID=273384 RepID=A0A2H1KSL8_BREAU|nr:MULTISPECIES: GNAT family N-acetyltransferase [Brevibacterium]AZL04989.1 N-acetyltransferase [Brevibacterium aurantiacum]AZL12187.1 N-acetyltransferase [Brevibacterium aurantiacum]AZT96412.1 N-acetyltransferase [Brevibacterium aurantiacum]MDN5658202.1 GNAT family N-acetyltransferase [Brevibacterium sandarakinum]RCS97285.1 GNAT family N-acetyltransferase [Brevibacterium aurantiacum]
MAPAPAISIRLNDPADDDAFHAWHEVFAAASSHDRGPDAPVWPEAELSAELRTQRTSSMTELYLVRSATEADSAIGAIALTMPLSDNRHRVDAGLYVDPGSRRRGVGSAMLEFVRSRTKELDRRVISSEVFRPFRTSEADSRSEDVETTAPGIAFAEHHGFTFAIGDLRSECPLPVDSALVRTIAREARPFHEGFEFHSWSGDVPEEFVEQWALMEGLIETEAPTGVRDVEPEATSAADIREQEAIFAMQGRTSFAAIALDSSGDIAAYTQLVHSSVEAMVYQWGTLVRDQYRGHRLGAAVKAAAAHEFSQSGLEARAIITYNAEENEHMLAINQRLGFRPVERIEEVELNLDA